MRQLNEYLSAKVKPSSINATDENIKQIVKSEVERMGPTCDLNHIEVGDVTNMSSLFYEIDFDGDISEWNVFSVKNMDKMFYHNHIFTGKQIENWNIKSLKTAKEMFMGCKKLNCNLSKWNVSNIEYMNYMFGYCDIFEGTGLEKWKPKSALSMFSMFKGCGRLRCDLSKWNAFLANTKEMFFGCRSLENNLPKWYTKWYKQ